MGFLGEVFYRLGRIDLEEWEHVTCMKTVALKSQETVSGLKGYIAAGTCLMQGEEVTCRGRVSPCCCCFYHHSPYPTALPHCKILAVGQNHPHGP